MDKDTSEQKDRQERGYKHMQSRENPPFIFEGVDPQGTGPLCHTGRELTLGWH